VLHQVGVSFDLYCDARKHKLKLRRHNLLEPLFWTLEVIQAAAAEVHDLLLLLHRARNALRRMIMAGMRKGYRSLARQEKKSMA